MSRLLRPLLDIRTEERLTALLLGSTYFFLLMTHYLLKPARDSLFLTGAGVQELPYVYLATSILTVPTVGLYVRASRSLSVQQAMYGTWIVLGVQLVAMRFLLTWNHPSVYYLFYAWVAIFGALTTSQFWLLAGNHFDSGQAKRIFPHLGTFGILGAVAGGEVTNVLVTDLRIATADLLWLALVLLAITMILFANAGAKGAADPARIDERDGRDARDVQAGEDARGGFRLLGRSPHLVVTIGIIAAALFATTLVDYQFKSFAAATHADTSSLTGFFATFYGRVSAISLVVQLFSPLLVRWLGAAGVLLLLPSLLFTGTVGILLVPGLLAATFAQGSALTLEYSLDRTGRELLFLPVPTEVKRRAKIFSDLVVDRSSRGAAGVLLLVTTGVLGFGAWEISWVVAVVLVVWLVLVLRMRPYYVDAFRRALARRELDLDTGIGTHDPAALRTLVAELGSEDPRRVSYAISALQSFRPRELEPYGLPARLCPLATRPEPEIRSAALRLLASGWPTYPELDLSGPLGAAEPEVRSGAVHLLLASSPAPDRRETFLGLLRDEDEGLVVAALDTFAEHGTRLALELESADANRILAGPPRPSERLLMALARAVGRSPSPTLDPVLETLLSSRGTLVLTEVVRATGLRRRPEHVPWLLARLSNPGLRPVARRALAAYGEPVVDTLRLAIHDLALPADARGEIPAVLERIDSEDALRLLLEEIVSGPPALSDACIASANRMRRRSPWRKAQRVDLDACLLRVGRELFAADQAGRALRSVPVDDDALSLFRQATRERRDAAFAQVFDLLGLLYRPRDIDSAYRGLRSRSRTDRANAREFLGETLSGRTYEVLRCAIAERGRERAEFGRLLYGFSLEAPEDAVRHYLHSQRPWIRSCAIWAAAQIAPVDHRETFLEAVTDESTLVRETARLALGRRAVPGDR